MRQAKLGIAALGVYILGGISAFTGIGWIVAEKMLPSGGAADPVAGYILLTAGVVMSLAGVLAMRIYRNHG